MQDRALGNSTTTTSTHNLSPGRTKAATFGSLTAYAVSGLALFGVLIYLHLGYIATIILARNWVLAVAADGSNRLMVELCLVSCLSDRTVPAVLHVPVCQFCLPVRLRLGVTVLQSPL